MNALTLQTIVSKELGSLRIGVIGKTSDRSGLRQTIWSTKVPGFGTRHYASGRRIYIVQAAMEGRTRTVTIGNAKVLSRAQAIDVARRVLLRAQVGKNPAEKSMRRRKVPLYADFLETYWRKASTVRTICKAPLQGCSWTRSSTAMCRNGSTARARQAAPARPTVPATSCAP